MDAQVGTLRPTSAVDNAVHRLVPVTWDTGLPMILFGLAVSFILFGFFNPYWRITDQDILLIYDAFLQNDGLPRQVTLHPAHLIVTALSALFQGLNAIGLMPAHSLSTLPPASDAEAFNAAWNYAVRIARVVCLVIVFGYVTIFAFLLRKLTRDWRAALIGAAALAFSGGIAMASRAVKPELLSGALVAIALLVLLVAARAPQTIWRPMLIGAAALAATLALDNKVQAIFLIGAMPVLLLPFGAPSERRSFWHCKDANTAAMLYVLAAMVAVAAAWPLLAEGIFPRDTLGVANVMFSPGVFHAMLAVWLGLGMLAFGRIWNIPFAETAAAAAAAIGGMALGLLPLYLHHEAISVVTVLNPIDALLAHSGRINNGCTGPDCASTLGALADGVIGMLKHHSFVLDTSPRPEIFVEWAVIAGIVYAYRRGRHLIALQAALLIATVMAIDTMSAVRDIKQDYFHFSDPLIILAMVLLIAKLPGLPYHRLAYPVGVALVVAHVVLSQAEPLKHAWLLTSGPQEDCVILDTLQRIERFPFCRAS